MPDAFKAKELDQFINSRDRVINPFFVGREVYQKKIDKLNQTIVQRHEENVSGVANGMTQVIYGAPGIGKSSLLEKIRQNCIDQLNNKERGPKTIPVMVNDSANLSFEYLTTSIRKANNQFIPLLSFAYYKHRFLTFLQSLGNISFGGIGVGVRSKPITKPIIPKGITIILMLDEIQSVPKDAAGVLQWLHTGSDNLPILPIMAGLSTSPGILSEYKISRLARDSDHPLPLLTSDEIKESFTKFVNYFNITSTPKVTNEWSERIVDWTDGWPKHVENAQAAVSELLLDIGGDLTKVDSQMVKLRAAEICCQYYNQRFGRYDQNPKIIGEIMAQIGLTERSWNEIASAIKSVLKKTTWVDSITSNQFPKLNFDYLLRRGFIDKYPLGKGSSSSFKCPIPSLQSYAVAQTGTPLHVYVYEGNLTKIMDALRPSSNINTVDDWSRTPLHLSVQNDWVEITQLLLNKGADPQKRDLHNRLPFEMSKKGRETYDMIYQATHAPTTQKLPDLNDGDDYEQSNKED
ncbi:MAG: hypothetical protein OXC02_09465 [Rhodobacteraceae bacterium]|nr:hypothetical protein [Paracoccaceae bacterium]